MPLLSSENYGDMKFIFDRFFGNFFARRKWICYIKNLNDKFYDFYKDKDNSSFYDFYKDNGINIVLKFIFYFLLSFFIPLLFSIIPIIYFHISAFFVSILSDLLFILLIPLILLGRMLGDINKKIKNINNDLGNKSPDDYIKDELKKQYQKIHYLGPVNPCMTIFPSLLIAAINAGSLPFHSNYIIVGLFLFLFIIFMLIYYYYYNIADVYLDSKAFRLKFREGIKNIKVSFKDNPSTLKKLENITILDIGDEIRIKHKINGKDYIEFRKWGDIKRLLVLNENN